MAKGYLATFDKYVESSIMLDSAKYYLDQSNQPFEEKFNTMIHYAFAKKEYQNILQVASKIPSEKIKNEWTAYRIGQAFFNNGDFENVIKNFENICTAMKKFEKSFDNIFKYKYGFMRKLFGGTSVYAYH